ncbi:hypothetical protein DMENIID0001_050840 [Sergentomyia squamirostris]
MTPLLVIIVIILAILVSIPEIRNYFLLHWKLRNLPVLKGVPLLGSAAYFFLRKQEDYLQILQDISKDENGPARFYLGPYFTVVISTPEDVKTLTTSNSCLDKMSFYRFYRCAYGLVTAPVPMWKIHRRLLTPSFSSQALRTFVPIFNDKAKTLLANLDKAVDCSDRDFLKYIFYCTLEMICETTLGYNIDVQNGKNLDYFKAVEAVTEIVGSRVFKFWYYPDVIYERTKAYAVEKMYFDIAYKLSSRLIAEKKQEYNAETFHGNSEILIQKLLKFLLAGELTEQEVQDEVDTMIATGHDTSALTLSNTLLMLAIHQDIQQKVLEEIMSVNPIPDAYVSFEDTLQFTYMEMVIKETLRHFPIVPMAGRHCMEDTKFSSVVIPKGTNFLLFIYQLHRRQEVWGPRVNEFYPEHFTPDNVGKRHPYSYIPFSSGLRNCIGRKYAFISMKIILGIILKNFRVTADGLTMADLKPSMFTTIRIKQIDRIRIERRNMAQNL